MTDVSAVMLAPMANATPKNTMMLKKDLETWSNSVFKSEDSKEVSSKLDKIIAAVEYQRLKPQPPSVVPSVQPPPPV